MDRKKLFKVSDDDNLKDIIRAANTVVKGALDTIKEAEHIGLTGVLADILIHVAKVSPYLSALSTVLSFVVKQFPSPELELISASIKEFSIKFDQLNRRITSLDSKIDALKAHVTLESAKNIYANTVASIRNMQITMGKLFEDGGATYNAELKVIYENNPGAGEDLYQSVMSDSYTTANWLDAIIDATHCNERTVNMFACEIILLLTSFSATQAYYYRTILGDNLAAEKSEGQWVEKIQTLTNKVQEKTLDAFRNLSEIGKKFIEPIAMQYHECNINLRDKLTDDMSSSIRDALQKQYPQFGWKIFVLRNLEIRHSWFDHFGYICLPNVIPRYKVVLIPLSQSNDKQRKEKVLQKLSQVPTSYKVLTKNQITATHVFDEHYRIVKGSEVVVVINGDMPMTNPVDFEIVRIITIRNMFGKIVKRMTCYIMW